MKVMPVNRLVCWVTGEGEQGKKNLLSMEKIDFAVYPQIGGHALGCTYISKLIDQ